MGTLIAGVVRPMRPRDDLERHRRAEADQFAVRPLPRLSAAEAHRELVKLLAEIREGRMTASRHRMAALEDACVRAWADARIADEHYGD